MLSPVILLTADRSIEAGLSQHLLPLDVQAEVVTTAEQALDCLNRHSVAQVWMDLTANRLRGEIANLVLALNQLPSPPAVVAIGPGSIALECLCGLDDLLCQWVQSPFLHNELEAALQAGRRPVPREPRLLAAADVCFSTRTPELIQAIDKLDRVAGLDVTLLFVGESGTGKTTLAQLVHLASARSAERFMAIPCGALPTELIESELFGHVRGAFTGADRARDGRFKAIGAGTLLLDEIDTLTARDQAKLLRVIETGEFEPVGSHDTLHSQARLLVASNVDLAKLTQTGAFRSDLYYRINVLEFKLPPLRERPDDLVPMAVGFIEECCRQYDRSLNAATLDFLNTLRRYDWPGNIRELKNRIRRAVMFANSGTLTAEDLGLNVTFGPGCLLPAISPGTAGLVERVSRSEREILEEALRANNFRRAATARSLGISRVGLYKKLKKHGLDTRLADLALPRQLPPTG